MSDLLLFLVGCLVSLVVLAAVGLLLWGAANEPKGTLLPDREHDREHDREWQDAPRTNGSRSPATADRVAG